MKIRKTTTAAGTPVVEGSPLAQALAGAIDHLRNERTEEAEPALLDILARWPEQPDALHFLGVLRHTQGRIDEAVALIRGALAQVPDNAGACRGWSVWKAAGVLMSVNTFACSFSANATRAFHASRSRPTRPISIAGFLAFESSCAASFNVSSFGNTGGGGLKRPTSGSDGSGPIFASCSAASRLM